ncbi:MAG TPA: hypothetical protein VFE47_24055 [Tepidisphaeraceae bacterium]|jgi:hypothetical protein|nr:hypothetical protein [Tepidisphaeraceae bacterium]
MRCWLILFTAALLTAATEMSLSVAQLEMFIRSAVDLKQPDRQVAEYLRHVKLRDKLDDRTIEDMQSMGAGPKTVAALRELGEASTNLPAPPPPPPPPPAYVPPPPPDSIEQAKIIDQAREYALNYTKQLPNFICVQVTRRDFDPTGSGNNWYHADTITARLSYNGMENYEVILHNNQPVTNASMRQFGGTTSEGEFGSMMNEIFDPETHTEFSWDHWGKLRGRKTYVFAYDVQQEYSKYRVEADDKLSIIPAYRGLVYIDEDTKMVLKIVMKPYDMPSSFPIHDIVSSLDYDFANIGDQQFMLPLKSVLTSKRDRQMSKNDIEFRLYRKFGTESTIKFETPDALPDDQTTEKPAGEPPQK